MATGGRVLHHLVRFLGNKRNTVIFTSYQAPGTRGEQLLQGAKEIKIFGQMTKVRAQLVVLEQLSAHADYNGILEWLKTLKNTPKKVFITHGTIDSAYGMKKKIENQYHWKCVVPKYQQSFDLT